MARGGYRPGSGPQKGTKYRTKGTSKPPTKERPPEIPPDVTVDASKKGLDPLTYMLGVMNDATAAPDRRDRMAVAAAPFVHSRKGEGQGKKDEREQRAKAAGSGKFAASLPPLKVVK